jgi:hypothetical protein
MPQWGISHLGEGLTVGKSADRTKGVLQLFVVHEEGSRGSGLGVSPRVRALGETTEPAVGRRHL